MDHDKAAQEIRQFFNSVHLSAELGYVSRPFGLVADQMIEALPANAERTAGLRKLLEAKDCALRAFSAKP